MGILQALLTCLPWVSAHYFLHHHSDPFSVPPLLSPLWLGVVLGSALYPSPAVGLLPGTHGTLVISQGQGWYLLLRTPWRSQWRRRRLLVLKKTKQKEKKIPRLLSIQQSIISQPFFSPSFQTHLGSSQRSKVKKKTVPACPSSSSPSSLPPSLSSRPPSFPPAFLPTLITY